METERFPVFTDINPILQQKVYEHYRIWAANRECRDNQQGLGMVKCTNCKRYVPIEYTVIKKFESGSQTRRCLLCEQTIGKRRIKRK
jgi:hypothetical protein